MDTAQKINSDTASTGKPERRRIHAQIPDDKAMLRAAAELTRDINKARPEIYWPDMIGSALVGYAAMAGAILVENGWLALALGVVSVLTLYRALLFIHEISHLHRDALPGFRTAWNAIVGIPMLTPSFMYEGVHTLHHARTKYGTLEDPEYMPLALMKPWSLPIFVLVAALAPVGLLIRFGILTPLGALFPGIRKAAWERGSALAINPAFRRRPSEGNQKRRFFWQEVFASVWAVTLIVLVVGFQAWRPLLIAMAITSAVAVFNQLRTLVAHLWENDGEAMTVTAQYLDSVNVPPPSPLAALWAPVGLRYHALHHLIPSMPYHSLGEAHKRIRAHLGDGSTFDESSHKGMIPLVGKIARSTMRRRET
ncbi:fatty acid desaturase family protein [Aurantiacibacter gangjinensis]|uniref:Fatty acid desaturase n=1 Tax=Aurantiacibacter gangjinensis TaxID=502682 RepID=A0A0G9MP23_9SPHN|nr:fatty acid desaturase [Aurantiacibacter gangjinensis]APE29358.1 Fatty acid desaturase, type 2 [Aurantiacibacter gangjinensis]KLE31063.1 fatty acid desaturase [Aurantiacibacter gangjinensis]